MCMLELYVRSHSRLCCLSHLLLCFFFSSRRRHTRCSRDWSSDVCSSDLLQLILRFAPPTRLDLPDRTDPFGLHALSPQRDSVSIDFVVGSDFQIGISFCSGQNQPAAQGHLLRGSLSRFPTNQ